MPPTPTKATTGSSLKIEAMRAIATARLVAYHATVDDPAGATVTPNVFAADQVVYLAPFFLAAACLHTRHSDPVLSSPTVALLAACVLLAALVNVSGYSTLRTLHWIAVTRRVW